jgi:membrane-bound serine protease (ClpP class)
MNAASSIKTALCAKTISIASRSHAAGRCGRIARPVWIEALEGETVYSDLMRLLFPVFPLLRLLQFCSAMLLLLPGLIMAGPVMVLKIGGVIAPANADFIERGLHEAAAEGAHLIILQMDTPGGLDSSMRRVIREILASPVPVAAFVAPSGARAASAGTYVLYASHIAAMAPGTNLGAATPVRIDGLPEQPRPGAEPRTNPETKSGAGAESSASEHGVKTGETRDKDKLPIEDAMSRKAVHDAAAYIRSLAQLRGRNADWAERAVREAVSLSAVEALDRKVIDYVAADVPELLKQVNNRKVSVLGREQVLDTASAMIRIVEPDWRTQLLAVITDPSIAYILMLIGIYGLFFELSNPGFVLPGVAGAICLLLALYSFQLLPVSFTGIALILLGIAFMIAEAFFPSFGALGIGGIIAFAAGSLMLIETDLPGYGIPLSFVAGVTLASAVFLVFVIGAALKAYRSPIVSGREALVGATGEMLENAAVEGMARVQGELWKVRCAQPLLRGQKVRVTGIDGLVLQVTSAEK